MVNSIDDKDQQPKKYGGVEESYSLFTSEAKIKQSAIDKPKTLVAETNMKMDKTGNCLVFFYPLYRLCVIP